MELSHLLQLVSELPNNSTLTYVRGTDTCKFIDVDIPGERINSETPTKEPKSWAPSYLQELAPKIKENVPFNLSGLLNNKGSFRPVLETIIAHTREFYTVRKGTATALVWIPSKPKASLELEEINNDDIPAPIKEHNIAKMLSSEELPEYMKKAFLLYFSNYLRLSTGKCDEAKISQYLKFYNRFVEDPLKERSLDYYSIFQFTDLSSLNDFLFSAKESLPDLAILLDDKWPQNKEDQTLYYEVWTMVRHYKAFLELLKSINLISPSINTSLSLNKIELNSVNSNDFFYLRAMRTKPFLLLAGISGTGKSRIVRKLAQATVTEDLQKKYDKDFKSEDFSKDRWELHRPANFELIQVKPNWHNSMDVVGYLSNIPSPHYVFTPFINFIVKAWQNPEVPFFLCLDEMNLAPVEEYFAEFLSAIESRDKQNGQYITDPIIKPFNEFGDKNISNSMIDDLFPNHKASKADEKFLKLKDQLLTKGLTLPPNLIVIGTVNMDETTFSFSRKVLDRAMSIEMNVVNYDAFLLGDTDEGLKELVENRDDINELLVDRPIKAKEVLDAMGDDKNAVLEYLKRINTLLEGTPFKLGYRAANEAILYLNASYDFGNNDWREAMDQFTLMKILSRIEGDTNKLRIGNGEADQKKLKDSGVRKEEAEKFGPLTLLTAMRVIIEDELKEVRIESSETEVPTNEDGSILDTSEVAPPKPEARDLESIKKLDSMISQLERERFVSYWN